MTTFILLFGILYLLFWAFVCPFEHISEAVIKDLERSTMNCDPDYDPLEEVKAKFAELEPIKKQPLTTQEELKQLGYKVRFSDVEEGRLAEVINLKTNEVIGSGLI